MISPLFDNKMNTFPVECLGGHILCERKHTMSLSMLK